MIKTNDISYVKLKPNDKIPISTHTNWQNEKCPYDKIKTYKGNLGIATGKISGGLYVLDWDFREGLKEEGFKVIYEEYKKTFLKLSKYIDCWTISADRKLLHWGPVPVNINDSDCINKEAEKYATRNAGMTRTKINTSSEQHRKSWFNHYVQYVDEYFKDMPTGWYKTEDIKVKDITSQAIKL